MIVLHCGGNDIGILPLKDLMQLTVNTIRFVALHKFPGVKLIWSQILPRHNWKYSNNQHAMEKARKRLNSLAAKTVLDLGGAYIKHPQIYLNSRILFHSDGVHLSDRGNAIFLRDIKSAIEHFRSGAGSVYPDLCTYNFTLATSTIYFINLF